MQISIESSVNSDQTVPLAIGADSSTCLFVCLISHLISTLKFRSILTTLFLGRLNLSD